MHEITESLSMVCSGYCEQERHGAICQKNTGIGRMYIDAFCRWRDKGEWERLPELPVNEPDFEWLMIDASHIKVHPHAAGAVGDNQDMRKTKGGSTPGYICPWMRMVCRSECLLRQVPHGEKLINGIHALALLADRGYDINRLIDAALQAGIQVVIPPKRNRKEQREYDKYLYKLRHFVENAFPALRRWRGISTRYARNTASFPAAVQIRCIAIRLKIYWRHYLKL